MINNGDDSLIPYPLEILTERLVLRSPALTDAQGLFEAVSESLPELKQWMPWAQEEPSVEQTSENIKIAIDEFKAQTAFRIHIFDRATGEIVGSSGYPRISRSVPALEIGYWIRSTRTGQGLCGEVVRALTDYAFQKVGTQRVAIHCDDRNLPSCRVAQREGFTLEGTLRNDCLDCCGQPRNTRIYSKISSDI